MNSQKLYSLCTSTWDAGKLTEVKKTYECAENILNATHKKANIKQIAYLDTE